MSLRIISGKDKKRIKKEQKNEKRKEKKERKVRNCFSHKKETLFEIIFNTINLISQINPLDTSPLRYTTLCFLTTVESAYLDKFGTDTK